MAQNLTPTPSALAAVSGPAPGVSVLVLTRNEEINIAACLECLRFSDDVVVLDSLSTDRTVEIARSFPNVRVFERPFDTEYLQRNFGLHEISYRHPWLYICDADELVPGDLAREILARTAQAAPACAAFRLRYKNMFHGRWIKHATSYPVWLIRLVRPGQVAYEVRQTNVHPIVQGDVGELTGHFIHFSFNTGLRRWFEKHNFYSDREALEGVRVQAESRSFVRGVVASDPMVRRRAMKNLSFLLPGRSLWRFLYSYFWRMGILDGRAGFHYCAMISMYEFWIALKMREHRADWTAQTDATAQRLLASES